MADPYEILGVAREATQDDIRKAYRRLAKKNHPDLHPGDKGAEARFKAIASAYDIVGDEKKRARFDSGDIDASGAERQQPEREFYRQHAEGGPGFRYDRRWGGSEEDGAETLGILPGSTGQLVGAPALPHIGWNQVERRREHPLFDGIADGADFYFVHSYAGVPGPGAADVVLAETDHGTRFPSAIADGPLLGVQFHPERSGTDGLRLLANYVSIVARQPATPEPVRAPA